MPTRASWAEKLWRIMEDVKSYGRLWRIMEDYGELWYNVITNSIGRLGEI